MPRSQTERAYPVWTDDMEDTVRKYRDKFRFDMDSNVFVGMLFAALDKIDLLREGVESKKLELHFNKDLDNYVRNVRRS